MKRVALTAAAMVVAALVPGGARYAATNDDPDPAPAAVSVEPMTPEPPSATDEAAAAQLDRFVRADCKAKADHLAAREEADLIDWAAIEAEERIDEDRVDEASIELERPPVDGRVAAPGERPKLERFGTELDLATVPDIDLLEAVGACEDAGLLSDTDR